MAGVHPAQERLDQPVHDLVAEPAGDQVADREVLAHRQPGLLGLDPRQPLRRQDAGLTELGQVERHAHQRARQRPQPAAGPDPRGLDGRVHRLQPELAGQVDALGPPVEHRLGADVDEHAADLGPAQLAAGLGSGLEHGDLVAAQSQEVGRGQPRDPAPDDHDSHPVSLSDATRRPRTAPTGCWWGRCEGSQAA